jgi:hypothetical protein
MIPGRKMAKVESEAGTLWALFAFHFSLLILDSGHGAAW